MGVTGLESVFDKSKWEDVQLREMVDGVAVCIDVGLSGCRTSRDWRLQQFEGSRHGDWLGCRRCVDGIDTSGRVMNAPRLKEDVHGCSAGASTSRRVPCWEVLGPSQISPGPAPA